MDEADERDVGICRLGGARNDVFKDINIWVIFGRIKVEDVLGRVSYL